MKYLEEKLPIGSLVRPKPNSLNPGMDFRAEIGGGTTLLGTYDNVALVIGPGRSEYSRMLFFNPPWSNREGIMVTFAEVGIHDVEIVK